MERKVEEVKPTDELGKIVVDHLVSKLRSGFILVGNERTFLVNNYLKYADRIDDFDVRDSDVFVITHPKSGKISKCLKKISSKVILFQVRLGLKRWFG